MTLKTVCTYKYLLKKPFNFYYYVVGELAT